MKKLKVELGERSYIIVVQRDSLDEAGRILNGFGLNGKCMLVTNATVDDIYGQRLLKSLTDNGFNPKKVIIEDSERSKSLGTVEWIFKEALEFEINRNCAMIALGGGVVGDVTGFVAATYMRGIPFVQIPTTLLAQVDSSVGGKVGINHLNVKNLVGSFHQPKAVIIDPTVLYTLPLREYRAGLAEAIKYGIIWDKNFFSLMEGNIRKIQNRRQEELEEIILRSCKIKAEIVSRDEREQGLRMILNLGHTFGHALEVLGGLRTLKHGEAVAIGTCLASTTAEKLGLLSRGDKERILNIYKHLGLPTLPQPNVTQEDILAIMKKDKKNRDDDITLILPKGIGTVEKMGLNPQKLLKMLHDIA